MNMTRWGALVIAGAVAGFVLPSARAAGLDGSRVATTPAEVQTLSASPRDVSFEVYPREIASVVFAAGQPGSVHITARWKGAPLTLVLHSRTRKLAEVKGDTDAALQYTLSDADLKEGSLWTVSLLAAPAAHPLKLHGALETKPLAQGTLHIEHPAADTGKLEGDLRLLFTRNSTHSGGAAATHRWAATRQAAYVQERAAVHAAMLKSAQEEFATNSPPAGSNNGSRQLFTLTPEPAIDSLDRTEGDPGTPVLISGAGFGSGTGEVHFILGAATELTGPVVKWTDSQVLTSVPSVDGIPAYDGYLYVKTADGIESDLKPFHFNPVLDRVDLDIYDDTPNHDSFAYFFTTAANWGWASGVHVEQQQADPVSFFLDGWRGDDGFYHELHLINGWVVDQVHFQDVSNSNHAAATVAESYENTDWAYVKVHWWYNAANAANYLLSITVRGPKGLPYR